MGPAHHFPHSLRLQKIMWGYDTICLCSLAGYKKNDILESFSEEYQEYYQLKKHHLTPQLFQNEIQ